MFQMKKTKKAYYILDNKNESVRAFRILNYGIQLSVNSRNCILDKEKVLYTRQYIFKTHVLVYDISFKICHF